MMNHDKVLRGRRRASQLAVYGWIAAGLALVVIGTHVVAWCNDETPEKEEFVRWFFLGPCALACAIGGIRFWRKAAREDRAHHKWQKSPTLPLALVRDHDDAWIAGDIRCPRPLISEKIERLCSWFHVVVEAETGKDGRYVKVFEAERGATIWITDGQREIEVDLKEAVVDSALVRRHSEQRGEREHLTTLRYLRAEGPVSACGLVRYRAEVLGVDEATRRDNALHNWLDKHSYFNPDAEQREPHPARGTSRRRQIAAPVSAWHTRSLDEEHAVTPAKRLMLTDNKMVPLMVTPLQRGPWHEQSEAEEVKMRQTGDVGLGLGIPVGVEIAGSIAGWWTTWFWPGLGVGLLVFLAVLLPSKCISLYNRMVEYRQRIRAADSNVQADEQLRADLVPQLVQLVEAAATHERATHAVVAELRRSANATDTIVAMREAYPELTADANFRHIADELTGIEEKLAFGRSHMHDTIEEYNNLVQSFPNVLLASLTGFRRIPIRSVPTTRPEVRTLATDAETSGTP